MAGQQCRVCGGTTEGEDCCCRTLVRPYVGDESAEPAPAPPSAARRPIRDGLPRPLVDPGSEPTAGRGDAEAAGWIFADFGTSPSDSDELLTRVLGPEPVSRIPEDEILAPPLLHQALKQRWIGLPSLWKATVIAGAALLLFGAGATATYRWGFETAAATGYGQSPAPAATSPVPATVTATATSTATATVTASPKTTAAKHTTIRRKPTPTTTRPQAPPKPPPPYCSMDYTVVDQWSDGFEVDVAVDYFGSQRMDDWHLSWDFPSGQRIEQIWDAQATQAGPAVNVTNAPYNGSVQQDGTIEFGFVGSWYGENDLPGRATLNGSACVLN